MHFDPSGAEASRTTYVMGQAVADGARRLRVAIRDRFGCDPAELAPDRLVARSPGGLSPEPLVAWDPAAEPVRAEGYFEPAGRDPPPVVGAHFCEVEVDCATGAVRMLRYVAAQDVGWVINPLGRAGQMEGGIRHGIGYALTEELPKSGAPPIHGRLAAADGGEVRRMISGCPPGPQLVAVVGGVPYSVVVIEVKPVFVGNRRGLQPSTTAHPGR